MSGGSQHNPNGRQSQLGPGWSPLQVANFLARAPQVHMPADRGVTWHTPTPPPHLYHVPAPSPPDPLQAMKSVGSNSVFRHSATPPELFRHTPTPPDKHLLRHTPSPGDVKAGPPIPPAELYPHLGPGREKLVRPEELLAYARVGVDLSLSGRANGSPASPALSVRDAPTINSLIARAQRPPHARVDALLERLAPATPPLPPAAHAPASPLSVIVHPRAAPSPSPPSSNEDSADSCGAPPGSKRKRKPERTLRVPAPLPIPTPSSESTPTPATIEPEPAPAVIPNPSDQAIENGDTPHTKVNGPEKQEKPPTPPPQPDRPPTRRKTRSGSAETIDDIAAMIASTDRPPDDSEPLPLPVVSPVTVDNLKSVLASPEPVKIEERTEEKPQDPIEAAAPKRRTASTSNSESANVPVQSPSEAKPAEPDTSEAPSAEPTAASFVEVENQLEKMFAGIEETSAPPQEEEGQKSGVEGTPKARKRRKSTTSTPMKAERKPARRCMRAATVDERKTLRKKDKEQKEGKEGRKKARDSAKDAYDSGSNASSSKSRGPYIQIRGPRASPVSVSVMNACEEEEGACGWRRRGGEGQFRNGLRLRGLHASTLGLRYDAATADATWRCAFCARPPHHARLGDLFGPYAVERDCDEYRALDEATRAQYAGPTGHGGVVPRGVRRVGAGRGGGGRARVGAGGRRVGGARRRVPRLPPPARAAGVPGARLPRARAPALRARRALAARRRALPRLLPRPPARQTLGRHVILRPAGVLCARTRRVPCVPRGLPKVIR
ncbi:hypothetical protein ACJJTC_003006 [Scirpophaga incertulas]